MPKFKISFYRTLPEYAHLEVEAADRATANYIAHNIDMDELEWVGGNELDDIDLEYDIEEISEDHGEVK